MTRSQEEQTLPEAFSEDAQTLNLAAVLKMLK